ncbi:MAG: aa3-type cytochrome c oxidase subunit IV [Caulobacteraceae bacterium]|nr:aa3-type cytochrome c oxidase subunit IV [Caulobacteraceae bacterium]
MADPHHDAHGADDYQRGSMAIGEQAATWKLVQAMFSWGSLGIAALLLALVMAFRPGGNILVGLVLGVILFAVGAFWLKSGSKSAH